MECSSSTTSTFSTSGTTSTSSTSGTPSTLAPPMRRNPGPVGRGAPLPLQRRTLGKAQRGPRTGVGCGRGQAYNLIAEEAEASGEVVARIILVHPVPVLSLFDSGASHCFISSRFTALHSIPLVCMGDQWKISTGNGVVITNKIYKACTVKLCDRELKADMFVLDTGGYDVILGMTWLSKYRLSEQESNLQNFTPTRVSVHGRAQVPQDGGSTGLCHC